MSRDSSSAKAIRAIAVLETTKGVVSLTVGFVLLSLLHENLAAVAGNLLEYLRVDPTGRFAQAFVAQASNVNEANIILFVVLAFAYTLVRFVEAYGLWRLRPWAEWFAIVSGAIYLPFEIYEIFQKPTVFKFAIFFFNVALVSYLLYVRREAQKHKLQTENQTKI